MVVIGRHLKLTNLQHNHVGFEKVALQTQKTPQNHCCFQGCRFDRLYGSPCSEALGQLVVPSLLQNSRLHLFHIPHTCRTCLDLSWGQISQHRLSFVGTPAAILGLIWH